jgi:hypothetical protein
VFLDLGSRLDVHCQFADALADAVRQSWVDTLTDGRYFVIVLYTDEQRTARGVRKAYTVSRKLSKIGSRPCDLAEGLAI